MDNSQTSAKTSLSLYPETVPHLVGRLKVSGPHELYFEECGSPTGEPVVLLHGGPGGGSTPIMRRYHDPSRYRIVLFDQRGCGRSTPYASLEENTTWHLVEDIERLREHLGIERWQVFGGSWGATLALAYAEAHPERVTGLVLRGVFTLRRCELEWFYQDGCSWLFPEAFEQFASAIPEAERGDMMAAFYRRLTDADESVQLEAARAWSAWEGKTLSLMPDAERVRRFSEDAYALAFARIECHYFVNGGFFASDDQLIANAHRLNSIPGVIVQGRYDVVTPAKIAYDLARAWPKAELRIVADAGHAMTEPGIVHELIAATQNFSENEAVDS
jgi:proline iminopeptidase